MSSASSAIRSTLPHLYVKLLYEVMDQEGNIFLVLLERGELYGYDVQA